MARHLICGARDFTDVSAIDKIIKRFKSKDIVIHGAARGADSIAGKLAKARGLKVIAFPADWGLFGRAAGPIRNQQMIEQGKPTKVWAFYTDKDNSRGTKDMVRRARKAGIKIWENK